MTGRTVRAWWSLPVFAMASAVAVAVGAWTMAQGGLPPGLWLRNPAAWLVAAGVALVLARWRGLAVWTVPAAVVLIVASLFDAGSDGVHRWLSLGPIRLNIAALVLPVAIATAGQGKRMADAAGFAILLLLLALQPDRSQLAALGVAAVIMAGARFGRLGLAAAIGLVLATLAVCLTRSDPLLPVAHVEGIVAMAWAQSPLGAVVMAGAIAAAALSPLLLWRDDETRVPAAALAAYLAVSALACAAGAYPVPLAGYGLSFVIGWWLGAAALAISSLRPAARPDVLRP